MGVPFRSDFGEKEAMPLRRGTQKNPVLRDFDRDRDLDFLFSLGHIPFILDKKRDFVKQNPVCSFLLPAKALDFFVRPVRHAVVIDVPDPLLQFGLHLGFVFLFGTFLDDGKQVLVGLPGLV